MLVPSRYESLVRSSHKCQKLLTMESRTGLNHPVWPVPRRLGGKSGRYDGGKRADPKPVLNCSGLARTGHFCIGHERGYRPPPNQFGTGMFGSVQYQTGTLLNHWPVGMPTGISLAILALDRYSLMRLKELLEYSSSIA